MLIDYKEGDRIVPSKYFLGNVSQACEMQYIAEEAGIELIKAYRDDIPIFVDDCVNGNLFRIKNVRIRVDDGKKPGNYLISPEWISREIGLDFDIDKEKILLMI